MVRDHKYKTFSTKQGFKPHHNQSQAKTNKTRAATFNRLFH